MAMLMKNTGLRADPVDFEMVKACLDNCPAGHEPETMLNEIDTFLAKCIQSVLAEEGSGLSFFGQEKLIN